MKLNRVLKFISPLMTLATVAAVTVNCGSNEPTMNVTTQSISPSPVPSSTDRPLPEFPLTFPDSRVISFTARQDSSPILLWEVPYPSRPSSRNNFEIQACDQAGNCTLEYSIDCTTEPVCRVSRPRVFYFSGYRIISKGGTDPGRSIYRLELCRDRSLPYAESNRSLRIRAVSSSEAGEWVTATNAVIEPGDSYCRFGAP